MMRNIREGMRIKSYLGDVNPIPNNYIQVGLFSEIAVSGAAVEGINSSGISFNFH